MQNSFTPWLPIRGKRLLIRCLAERDLHRLYELESDPWVKQFIPGGPVTASRESWLASAAKLCNSGVVFCVASKKTDLLLGRVSVGHYPATGRSTDREIQIVLCRDAVGKGLGQETLQLMISAAKSRLGATRLFAEVQKRHVNSAALARKLGFVEESSAPDSEVRVLVLHV